MTNSVQFSKKKRHKNSQKNRKFGITVRRYELELVRSSLVRFDPKSAFSYLLFIHIIRDKGNGKPVNSTQNILTKILVF